MTNKEFKQKSKEIQDRLQGLLTEISDIIKSLKELRANFILNEMNNDPILETQFLNKLYDPFYEPNDIEEIVIQKILEKQQKENE